MYDSVAKAVYGSDVWTMTSIFHSATKMFLMLHAPSARHEKDSLSLLHSSCPTVCSQCGVIVYQEVLVAVMSSAAELILSLAFWS